MKVLLIEDEDSIRSFVRVNLKRQGYEVMEASSGEEGLNLLNASVDIVLLDLMLPGIDGFEVCKRIRQQYAEMGVIMLTAKGQESNKVIGLEIGADDYIVKPFSPQELIARMNSLSRRLNSRMGNDENKLITGIFTILVDDKRLLKDGVDIELTPIEFQLVKFFMENDNKALHRDEILNNVWGYNYVGDFKIVDVNIRRIRQKIEEDPSKPKFIEKVWGYGYRWSGGVG